MIQEVRPAPAQPHPPVADLLEALHLASRQAHEALTLWPLLQKRRGTRRATRCIALCEALESGSAVVADAAPGESGSQGVALTNHGDDWVIVLLDPEFAGGERCRDARPSALVAPRSVVVLDRARLALERRAHSPRPRHRGADLDAILETFHTVEDQVGFVAAAGDAVVGIELLESPALFRALFPRLLHGYRIPAPGAFEAMDARARASRRLRFAAPEPFLRALSRARWRRERAHGAGTALHLESAGVLRGYALEAVGIAHLSAFADFGA